MLGTQYALRNFILCFVLFFLRFYLFICRERGRAEKERERNSSMSLPLMPPLLGTRPTTQACSLTGNQTSDPLVHRPVLNPLSHTSQGMFCFSEMK